MVDVDERLPEPIKQGRRLLGRLTAPVMFAAAMAVAYLVSPRRRRRHP